LAENRHFYENYNKHSLQNLCWSWTVDTVKLTLKYAWCHHAMCESLRIFVESELWILWNKHSMQSWCHCITHWVKSLCTFYAIHSSQAQFVHYLEVNVNIFVFIAVDSSLYGMFTISRLYCMYIYDIWLYPKGKHDNL
jgi:hypothetical protein